MIQPRLNGRQSLVANIEGSTPNDSLRVQARRKSSLCMVVRHRGKQIVGGGHGMQVARKM